MNDLPRLDPRFRLMQSPRGRAALGNDSQRSGNAPRGHIGRANGAADRLDQFQVHRRHDQFHSCADAAHARQEQLRCTAAARLGALWIFAPSLAAKTVINDLTGPVPNWSGCAG